MRRRVATGCAAQRAPARVASRQGCCAQGVEHQNAATEGLSLHDWFFRQGAAASGSSTGSASIPGSIPRSPRPGSRCRTAGTRVSSFFARFRLTGWKRLLNEAISEGLTLGVGGFAVLFVLAIPAFTRFRREQDQYRQVRGQIPRPQRQRDRPARHPAQRRGAARGDPRSPDQGDARHRGPPLLRALRRRRHRHRARPVRERARQRGGAGRLDHHPAARQEPVPVVGALAPAQAQGGVPRLPARERASPSARS